MVNTLYSLDFMLFVYIAQNKCFFDIFVRRQRTWTGSRVAGSHGLMSPR